MKKILVSMFAVAALAACTTEQTIVAPQGEAITFDTFVENSTRANDVNITSIKDFGFGVYASVTNTAGTSGLILNNESVTFSNNAWGYTNTQYWVVGNTYNFTAIAPKANAKWTYAPENNKTAQNGVISFNNREAAANQDLVFASASRQIANPLTSKPDAIEFSFDHMLSRVRFTFTNGFQSAGNIKLVVSNVHIKDAYANGTLAVENGAPAAAWVPTNKDLDINMGNVTDEIVEGDKKYTEHFYVIPNPESTTYTVTFDVKLIQAGVEIDTYSHTVELTCAMNRGSSYDIKTTFTPQNTSDDASEIYPIEFTVNEVKDWGAYNDMALEAKTVATATELATAVAEGGDVRLTQDIKLEDAELNVAAGNEVNVDLNGYTLTIGDVTTRAAAIDPIKNYGKMTIANGKIAAGYAEETRRCIYNYGEMVIENMEFVQTYDKKGAAINNEGKMTINNATVDAVFYSIWTSGANAETTINGGTYTSMNNEAIRDTWSYAVIAQNNAKLIINGGTFTGNHGVVCATYGAEATLNAGTFHCTCTYTGNSDWVLYTSYASGEEEPGTISYNEANCTFKTARTDGKIYYDACETHISKL